MKMNESSSLKREENVTKNPTPISDLEGKNKSEEATQKEEMKDESAADALEEEKEETSEADTNRKLIIAAIAVGAIVIIAIIAAVALLGGSPKEEQMQQTNSAQADVSEETTAKEEVAVKETSTEVQEKVDEQEKDATEEESEQVTQEVNEESEDSIEPTEMVEFELWATQPESDVPCLVVWNEAKKKQEIIQPGEKYITEEGDILAVPYKEGMFSPYVNSTIQDVVSTEYGQYYTIVLEETWNTLDFTFEGVTYKYVVKAY